MAGWRMGLPGGTGRLAVYRSIDPPADIDTQLGKSLVSPFGSGGGL
jgi:hypothetical protein